MCIGKQSMDGQSIAYRHACMIKNDAKESSMLQTRPVSDLRSFYMKTTLFLAASIMLLLFVVSCSNNNTIAENEINRLLSENAELRERLDALEDGSNSNNGTERIPSTPISYEYGNTTGNISIGNLAVISEERIYYINVDGDGCIYSMRADYSDNRRLSYFGAREINVLGDWIYYTDDNMNIYSMRIDGSDNRKLNDDEAQFINVVNDRIFYVCCSDDYKIYSMRIDGSDKNKLNDDASHCFNVVGDMVYYCNMIDDAQDGCRIYSMRTDGRESRKLSDDRTAYLVVADDRIYYSNADDSDTVYSIRIDGRDKKKHCESSGTFNISDGWIYYWYSGNRSGIYNIRTDGSINNVLSTNEAWMVHLVGDLMFSFQYKNGDAKWCCRRAGGSDSLVSELYHESP